MDEWRLKKFRNLKINKRYFISISVKYIFLQIFKEIVENQDLYKQENDLRTNFKQKFFLNS